MLFFLVFFHIHLLSPAFAPRQAVPVCHPATGPGGTDTQERAAAALIKDAGATGIIWCGAGRRSSTTTGTQLLCAHQQVQKEPRNQTLAMQGLAIK